jgi:hypothetical protein
MERFEYMRLRKHLIPEEIIKKYDLRKLVHNGFLYMEIQKGIYGLPQTGMLASKLLQKRLAKLGYAPTKHTHGLWKHKTRRGRRLWSQGRTPSTYTKHSWNTIQPPLTGTAHSTTAGLHHNGTTKTTQLTY